MSVVKSISYDIHDLLAGDDSDVFPLSKETRIRKDRLECIRSEGYGMPSFYLNIIFNEELAMEPMRLERKFKLNFKKCTKFGKFDAIEFA